MHRAPMSLSSHRAHRAARPFAAPCQCWFAQCFALLLPFPSRWTLYLRLLEAATSSRCQKYSVGKKYCGDDESGENSKKIGCKGFANMQQWQLVRLRKMM